MSEHELAKAESLLLQWLHDASGPLSMRDVLERRDKQDEPVTTLAMRGAVWQLVDKGQVELTSDNRLQPTCQQKVKVQGDKRGQSG